MTPGKPIKATSSANGLKAFVFVVCLAIIVIEGWRDWQEWQHEFASIEAEMLNLAKSLTQHAEDTFELADAILIDVIDRVETGDGSSPAAIEQMDELLAERIQPMRRFKWLTVYGEDGLLLSSSLSGHRYKVNVSSQVFFQHHSMSREKKWYLGPLIRDPIGSDWVITLSRRVDKPDGSFGGVVQVSIPPLYFSSFFSRFDLGSQGTIALFHTDGTLLSRYPYREQSIGLYSAHEPWLQQGVSHGTYEYVSPVDGVERISGYQRNHIFPVGVLASVGRDEALADWNREFVLRSIGVYLLIALIGYLGWNLAGQLKRREKAEVELAFLAATDGLTSLANRRTFDKALETEWRRMAREGGHLSLLLIDLDRFKAFNDRYGHQAGDDCLRKVAAILKDTMRRPGDLVARYGGEEIAILLPKTDEAGAAAVAEAIRSRIELLSVPHDANPPYFVLTTSIGGATLKPNAETLRTGPKELVMLADQALYRAKLAGRNRIASSKAA